MRARSRLAVMTCVLTIVGSGLYACSSSDGSGTVPNESVDSGGKPSTPSGAETGAPSGTDAAVAQQDGSVPQKCAIFEADAGNLPALEPAACRTCASEQCCGPMTKCYAGAKAPDAGSKTICQAFGECETNCAGNVMCEDQCSLTYGEAAADDWTAAETCLETTCAATCN